MSGLPAMLVTVLVFAALGLIATVSLLSRRLDILAKIVKISLVWAAAYLSLLIGAAGGSDEVVLEPGTRKSFCGAYVDCHLGVTVVGSWTSKDVVFDGVSWSANGKFLFVDVEVSSDAGNTPLHLRYPRATVITENGNRYERSRNVEHKFATGIGQPHSLSSSLQPNGSITKTLVFDVPEDARNPRLHTTNGGFVERLVELFLIGDEDSLFHKPVLLGLAKNPA